MQVNLSKDELEEYVAMVFPYTNVGDIEVSRELMKAIFGTAKKNIQEYGVIDYLEIERKDTVLLVQGKEPRR